MNTAGFPHSDICGSTHICSSPQLFAAYHVLLRLLMPRHSPCALLRLTYMCRVISLSRYNTAIIIFHRNTLQLPLTVTYFLNIIFRFALFSFQGSGFHFFTKMKMVGLSGLEPPTSRLSGVRSNRLSYKPIQRLLSFLKKENGGDEENRTPDPLLARQVLSQLSYTPRQSSF